MAQGSTLSSTQKGIQGIQGVVGIQGIQGLAGAAGVPVVLDKLPSGYVEMVVPVGTTAAALADVAGATTTVTLTSTTQIAVTASVNVKTQVGPDPSILGLALNINGVDYTTYQVNLSGVDDAASVCLTERSGDLAPGTYQVNLRFFRASGTGTPGVDKATLVAEALQGIVDTKPSWWGVLYGAAGDCDPARIFRDAVRGGSTSPTPANITATVARICYFRPPVTMTVNKIRYLGVGNQADGILHTAIYNGDTLVRVTADLSMVCAANTWGFAGSVANPGGNLGLGLTANQLYFIAVSVTSAASAAGSVLALSTSVTSTAGQISVLPKSWPGSLDLDAGYVSSDSAQFPVLAGALPDPAAAIATQAGWTGGFPAFFLDSSNA